MMEEEEMKEGRRKEEEGEAGRVEKEKQSSFKV